MLTEVTDPTPPAGPGRARRLLNRAVLIVVGVPAVLATLLVLWAPAVGWDGFPPLAQLAAFRVQLMGLVLTAGAGVALLAGRAGRVCGIALMVLALSPLPQILPRALAERPAETPGVTLTVLEQNVLRDNADVAALAQLAIDRRADVVVLPEASAVYAERVVRATHEAGVEFVAATGLPVRSDFFAAFGPSGSPFPTSLLVRADLRSEFDVQRPPGQLGAVTAVVRTRSGPVTLAAVHAIAPNPGMEPEWGADLREFEGLCGSAAPTIVVGDFNATLDHSPMRSLLAAGCQDAGAVAGRGLTGTWPADMPWPLQVPIDHLLFTSAAGTLLSYEVVDALGSDHRGTLTVLSRPQ